MKRLFLATMIGLSSFSASNCYALRISEGAQEFGTETMEAQIEESSSISEYDLEDELIQSGILVPQTTPCVTSGGQCGFLGGSTVYNCVGNGSGFVSYWQTVTLPNGDVVCEFTRCSASGMSCLCTSSSKKGACA